MPKLKPEAVYFILGIWILICGLVAGLAYALVRLALRAKRSWTQFLRSSVLILGLFLLLVAPGSLKRDPSSSIGLAIVGAGLIAASVKR